MNVVRIRPERRSTWAAKHLEFMETAFAQLAGHLADLSDEQLAVEAAEAIRIISASALWTSLAAKAVHQAYLDEAQRRGTFAGFPGGMGAA